MFGARFNRRGTGGIRGCVCCGCIPIPLFITASLAAVVFRRVFHSA